MKTKIKMIILRWALRLTLKDEHREAILIHELNHISFDKYGVSFASRCADQRLSAGQRSWKRYLNHLMARASQDFMFNDAVTSHDPDPYDEHGVTTKNSFNTP